MTKYLEDVNAPTFNIAEYVSKRLPPNYAYLPESERSIIRRVATRDDPLLWACIYFRKTLAEGGEGITLADMHVDICKIARHFRNPIDPLNPIRYAFIAPRRAGKTSWLYKIVATWLAAHQHRKFFLTLTGTGGQAQKWITNFKKVLDSNKLIREDYPDLVNPVKRESTGRAFADDSHMYAARSGFVIAAQGTDGNGLGLNFDDARPDMLLFDDIEPPGGSYSLYQMQQRLTNVLEGSIPMGCEGASIIFVGTVLMPGAIMDQIREQGINPDEKSWVAEESIRIRHYKPFIDTETGEETTYSTSSSRSFWEGRHKLENLLKMEGTRSFALKYANEPLPENGAYWQDGDIHTGTIPEQVSTITFISVDPAVTTKKKSDFTAVSVIRYAPSLDKAEVLFGRALKLNPGTDAPRYIATLKTKYPEIVGIFVEANQGGDLWDQFYGDMPGVRLVKISNTGVSKEERAADVLRLYQIGRVVHSTQPDADTKQIENEMYGFPNALHDDVVDSVCTGVRELRKRYGIAAILARADSESSYV